MKRRAFTLVELLVVLGIVALGWFWVPALFQTPSAAPTNQFLTHLRLLNARARMEALTRQRPVAFALRSDGQLMAVIASTAGDPVQLTQAALPSSIVLDATRSSSAGNPGIFAPLSTDDALWRAWWYNAQGQPQSPGGTLVFQVFGTDKTFKIMDEGALVEM